MRVRHVIDHTLIFRFYQQSRYSVAALLGAIECDPKLSGLRVLAPPRPPNETIRKHLRQGHVTVAYSVMSTQVDRVSDEVRRLRSQFGNTVTLLAGGPHASARPWELLDAGFDHVLVGEGEQAFPEMVWRLMSGGNVGGVEGVVSEHMETYPKPRDLPRVTLDDYPPFALDLNIVGPIEVTRGCPFACKFCCTPFLTGGAVKHRSVESIVSWLRLAVQKRNFKRTWFLSPNALCFGGSGRLVAPEKLEQLLSEATSIEGLEELFFGSFPSEVRPDFVSRDALGILRRYVSNETLQIGLQSGSDRILEATNRKHTVEEGMMAVRTTLDSGFVPHVDMIFGLPGENDDDVRTNIETCLTLIEMGAKIHAHVFLPLPGSAYENMPPGHLNEETRKTLGRLAKRGNLTGSWGTQEHLAEKLSSRCT